jgi:YjjW family glycine radical enzyme activase
MTIATINGIIKNSCVDGPGNRMTVFFQGCNINCLYCHNPETINLCSNCGKCVPLCPSGALELIKGKVVYYKNLCTNCDLCIKNCEYNSSPKTQMYSIEELISIIKKYRFFIRGITFSGGECTLNSEFIIEASKNIKNLNLDVYLDSNGKFDFKSKKELMENIDKVMLDIKAWDRDDHIKLTGYDNNDVLYNLKELIKADKLFEVRTVVIPEFLNNELTIREVSKLIANKNIRYKLIKYRPHGVRKNVNFNVPQREYMEYLKNIALEEGVEDIIII